MASVLSYFALPDSGLTISKFGVAFVVLGVMTLVFLVLSLLVQSWLLYAERFADLRVTAINKCKDHGGDLVVVFTGSKVHREY